MNENRTESNKVFNFGESSFKSKGVFEIPVIVKDKKFYLKTILQGDIPWLIGKKTMSKMGMMIYLKENKVKVEALGGI